jgi:general secretion pathway protein H
VSGGRAAGFTLIEILVVVVIMAIVISVAVLAIGSGGRDQQLDQESQRIEGLLGLLHDRALLEGRDFGMRIEPTAYKFFVYDTRLNRWASFDQEKEFRNRTLPAGVSFALELDSQQVVLKPIDPTQDADTPPPPPQLAIAASGDATPFRLTLLRDGSTAASSVSGDSTGKLTRIGSSQPPPPKDKS